MKWLFRIIMETCKDYNWFFGVFLKELIKYFPEIIIRKRTIKQWYTTLYWHLWWKGWLTVIRYTVSLFIYFFILYIFYIIYKIINFFLYIHDWSWIYEIGLKLPELSITEKLFWFWVCSSIFEYIVFIFLFRLYLWIIKTEKKFPKISTEDQRVFWALETKGFWSYFKKKTLFYKNFVNKHKEKKKELIYNFFFLKKHDIPKKFWFKLDELFDKFLTFIIWIRIAPEQLELKHPRFAKIYYYWLSIPYFIMTGIQAGFLLIKIYWMICYYDFLRPWVYYIRNKILYKIPFFEWTCSKILLILHWIRYLIFLPFKILIFTANWFEEYNEKKERKYYEKKYNKNRPYGPIRTSNFDSGPSYKSAREAFRSTWNDMMAELGPKYKALFFSIWPEIKKSPRKFILKIPYYWSWFKKNWIRAGLLFSFLPIFDLFFIFIVIESFFTYSYFFFFRKIWFKKDKKLFRRIITLIFLFIFILTHFIVAFYMTKLIIFTVLKTIIGLW